MGCYDTLKILASNISVDRQELPCQKTLESLLVEGLVVERSGRYSLEVVESAAQLAIFSVERRRIRGEGTRSGKEN